MVKKTILVVDDNKDIRYSVIQALSLSSKNLEFVEAEDGQVCLLKIKKGLKPDLIILDIMMPNMDGWDVVANLKSEPKFKTIPILFLTAKTDDLSKGMGRITSEDYVTKPFDSQDLAKRVKKIVGQ